MTSPHHSALRPGGLFCFGLGFCGARLACALHTEGWQVSGTSRDEAMLDRLRKDGIAGGPLESAAIPPGASHVLSTIPPGEAGDPVLLGHGEAIAAAEGLDWIGYLSTTGVYGDRGGEMVNEHDMPTPGNERSRRRLAAEEAWRDFGRRHGVAVQIFRLAGIYGPGRSALEAVRDGTAKRIDRPGHLFSRIHIDDIVATLMASMAHPRAGAVYNVCDDEAAAPADVTDYACELLGTEPPPLEKFDIASLSPMAQSFWAESRLVSNALIKVELGVTLRYPDYRAGLKAILAEEAAK